MPAVTVDDLTVLPRLHAPGLGDTVRPVQSVTTAPRGFEGEGFPVRRAFAGVDLQPARPVRAHGPDGRGGVRPRRAQGHPVAPAPRLRDRHLHDRRRHGPPGQPGRRWLDHQRRHPVDDGRLRDAAHRDAAGVAGRVRRAVPRRPAVGEPAARPEVGRRRATRTCAPASSAWSPPPTPAPWCASSPATSAATPARARRTRRWRWCTARWRRAPGSTCPGSAEFNALVYVLAGSGTVGARATAGARRSARRARPRRLRDAGGRGRGRRAAHPSMEVLVLGGRPIREPVAWGGPFVMNTKAEVMQAFEDFQKGRMGQIPAVHGLSNDVVEG